MKKILLINSNTEISPYPVAPLGISLLAYSLQKNYNVKVFDSAFNSTSKLIDTVSGFKPDYIGIGIRNIDNVTMRKCKWYINEIRDKVVKPLKEKYNVPLIIGGSAFSIAPSEILDYFDADYGIIGEGEEALQQLISKLENGNKRSLPERVISKTNKKVRLPEQNDPMSHLRSNIDKFIDFEPYVKRGSYPIQSKRGCSHKCIYCSYPTIEGAKYRLRSVKDIVDELEEVSMRIPGITFEFVDSTFNSPLNHAIDICREISQRKRSVKLRTMGINPGEVNKELILLMKNAGFAQIDCTPDSASEIMLKNYRKNFNKNKLIRAARIIKELDMPTMWFFMMGGPGETEETVLETFEFIDKYIWKEDMVHITEGIRIIPNTELYAIALKEGIISGNENVIEPMFYVSPSIGQKSLSLLLDKEIEKRNNVVHSIHSTPSAELMQKALEFRKDNTVEEPMFRTLLKVHNQI